MSNEQLSSGVQDLVDRLREKGIEEGRHQAEEITNNAKKEAHDIITSAKQEAELIISQARHEREQLEKAGRDAMNLAARDAILELKETLSHQFSEQVHGLVSHHLRDEDLLQRVILEIAGKARPTQETATFELLLPEDVIGLKELRLHPENVQEGTLSHFVLSVSAEMLREGVTIGSHAGDGVRIRLVDEDIEIDLSTQAITTLFLEHLLPRFRALLEGSIK
ncbi:hypothetical protein [Thiomicrorhabdus sp. 6S3-12]|uniref:hypothetical protein n=1 Tax=Thiomicrorhabdus sp. 6S3-12 TaxID=2819681 RepID=UPI001AAD0268|nr:hypothetical protein [Thiomicrorhabdus sp. 6S3-12]MBO1924166.1 hypothetical protein [Thiomicrorhabdus sp. 6S3-12]